MKIVLSLILTFILIFISFLSEGTHSIIVVSLFIVFTLLFLQTLNDFELRKILILAFGMRIIAAIVSFSGFFPLEGASTTGDASFFHQESIKMMKQGANNLLIYFPDYLENFYGYFVAWLYVIFGPFMIIPICINVLFGVGIVYRVYQICLVVNNKIIARSIAKFTAIIPWLIILSATLIREAPITFFIISSIYFLVSFYRNGLVSNSIKSIICILLTTFLHGGLIFISIIVCLAIVYFSITSKYLRISYFSGVVSSFLIVLSVFLIVGFGLFSGSVNIYKLTALKQQSSQEEVADFLQRKGGYAKSTDFNSFKRYRERIYIEKPIDFIKNLDIVIPFLFKPYITEFFKWKYPLHYFHSILMLFFLYLLIKNLRKIKDDKLLFLLITIVIVNTIVFAFGTSTVNASIRHNYKMVPIIICVLAEFISKFRLIRSNLNFSKIYFFYTIEIILFLLVSRAII